MLRNIIKYGGLALVIIGIILVMKNLFNSDAKFETNKKTTTPTTITSKTYYSATINLMDQETNKNIKGATLSIKDNNGNIVSTWTSEESAHLVTNLKKGKYTLTEETAPDGYHINKDGITFEIKNKDKQVTMYNTKMTQQELETYEKEQRELNTTSNEINVDNTLSEKDVVATMMAIICIISGIAIILNRKEA